ncbi:MAG: hypothetical protein A4E56_02624 [Pelotomaculum sp. PtaU1.Bin065]|nr:MAG: hypothetical protein A4E56_02624 [Pelotomaculum sp. PtaU1.Bin065]
MAIIYHGLQFPVLVQLSFRCILRLLDKEFLNLDVLRAKQQDTFPRPVVPSGAAGFLVVSLHVFGQVVVDHIADVGLVDTHAKSVRGNHNPDVVVKELVLAAGSLFFTQSGVVFSCGVSFLTKKLVQIVHFFPGRRVNDAGLLFPAGQVLQ